VRNACFRILILLNTAVFLALNAGALQDPNGPGGPQTGGPQYRLTRRMPIGGEGGWDYLTVDPEAHRIYVSRGTHVVVVDEEKGTVIGDIPDTKGVHGIALAPDLGRGFTSNGGEAMVTIFDLETLRPISKVKTTGEDPDSIIYDPANKRVFTFNGRSANATAIDAVSAQVVGTVPLGGRPESPVLDGKGSIFVNIEDKNQVVEFDAKTLAVKRTYPVAGCEAPTGIAMDTARRRIFVGCSDNNKMAVMHADTGKVLATPAICKGTDGVGFDRARGFAFASCGEGILSVVREDSPDKFSVVGSVETQAGARTIALDPKTHHIFVVTADFGPAGAPTANNPRPRPQPIPGTFVVLEFAPSSK
jgi:DNA-binding beta-propeller fold protein YncE